MQQLVGCGENFQINANDHSLELINYLESYLYSPENCFMLRYDVPILL